jgi:hypothetical protein
MPAMMFVMVIMVPTMMSSMMIRMVPTMMSMMIKMWRGWSYNDLIMMMIICFNNLIYYYDGSQSHGLEDNFYYIKKFDTAFP